MGDASDLEVQAGLEVAKRYRLDPFKQGQIWFIKRWDRNAVTAQGSKGAYTWTPQVGIYGMMHIAARDYPDYGSVSEAEFGPMFQHTVEENHKIKAPEWCRVKVYKKGMTEPTVATIYFEEFCPQVWENARLFWAKMPRAQLEKCAKARAIRSAYPDLGGLYIPEEMDRSRDDYTSSGRRITYTDSQVKELREARVEMRDAKSPEQARAAIQRFSRAAKSSGEPAESHEGGDTASRRTSPTRPPTDSPDLTLDWSQDEQSPRLTGNAELIERLKSEIHASWGKDEFWHVQPRDGEPLRAFQDKFGYTLLEVPPKSSPAAPQGATRVRAPAGDKSQAEGSEDHGKRGARRSEAGTPTVDVLEGKLDQVNPHQGKNPRLAILFETEPKKKYWLSCFDDKLFAHLARGKGQPASLIVQTTVRGEDTFRNVIGLKKVGSIEFDEDGKTPCIQNRDREAGNKTLFGGEK